MIRPANLHVLTREALERVRAAFPDPLIDVEHRGEGDCEVDGSAVVETIAALLGSALAALADGESLWMRSSGADASQLAVDLRWRGAKPAGAGVAEAEGAAERAGGRLVRDDVPGEHHLGFRVLRSP